VIKLREFGGDKYLTTKEVAEISEYGFGKPTLYYFRKLNYLDSFKFAGDKEVYWKVKDLEAIKNRPPEATKRGPKPHALTTAKPDRARGRTVAIGTGIPIATAL
jgi:hypothetical protein